MFYHRNVWLWYMYMYYNNYVRLKRRLVPFQTFWPFSLLQTGTAKNENMIKSLIVHHCIVLHVPCLYICMFKMFIYVFLYSYIYMQSFEFIVIHSVFRGQNVRIKVNDNCKSEGIFPFRCFRIGNRVYIDYTCIYWN